MNSDVQLAQARPHQNQPLPILFSITGGDPRTGFLCVIAKQIAITTDGMLLEIIRGDNLTEDEVGLLSTASRISDRTQFTVGRIIKRDNRWVVEV